MTEDFLHYIWTFQKFNHKSLKTVNGDNIVIIRQGNLNTDAGPDFSNANIIINDIEWYGCIEIHIRSSNWIHHKHHLDKRYNKVILHVVYEHDKEIHDQSGNKIPTCELKNLIDLGLIYSYQKLLSQAINPMCTSQLKYIDKVIVQSMIEMASYNRLEAKREKIIKLVNDNKSDWEKTFYQSLAYSFGFKKNSDSLYQLAKHVSLALVRKVRDSQYSMEALMLGMAGLLDLNSCNNYLDELKAEFGYLQKKFQLDAPELKHQWNFLRTRPYNFPTMRIVQFCALLYSEKHLFRKTIDSESIQELRGIFECEPSSFWKTHFSFKKNSKLKSARLGASSVDNIIINTVIPFLFAYGRSTNNQHLIDKGVFFLEQIPSESNHIIKKWENAEIIPYNALESQGLIQLYNIYCFHKKCLSCKIGITLVNTS